MSPFLFLPFVFRFCSCLAASPREDRCSLCFPPHPLCCLVSGKADGRMRTAAGLLAVKCPSILKEDSDDPRPRPLYMAAVVRRVCVCVGWGMNNSCSFPGSAVRGKRVEAEAAGQRAGTEASLTERTGLNQRSRFPAASTGLRSLQCSSFIPNPVSKTTEKCPQSQAADVTQPP